MRSYTYNNVTVTYGEQVLWTGDSNTITIESSVSTDEVGADIIIRHPSGVETRTIRHLSELPRIVFVIDDALIALDDDNIGQYTAQVNVYKNGIYDFSHTFSFQLLKGKSFTNQSHAISRTLYLYDPDELVKLQVYSPESGSFHFGSTYLPLYQGLNQYNMSQHITTLGTYTFCLENEVVQPVAVISGDTAKTPFSSTLYYSVIKSNEDPSYEEKGGDVWKYDETIFPVCYTIVYDEACWSKDFVELRYRDCDGCIRYLGGKLASETNEVGGTPYTRTETDNVFRNIPRKHIENTKRTLKVGFMNVAKNAYPQDILYSSDVYMRMYNSEWWPVVIGSDKIETKRDDTQDIELEIIISEE